MAVLLDSGFLFASLNASEAEHEATIQALESIRESIVLPVPAITEVAFLLARDIGQDAAYPRLVFRQRCETDYNSSYGNC